VLSSQKSKQIIEYLDGKLSYIAGLSLLVSVSRNPNLIRTLSGLETPKKRELLRYHLTKTLNNEQIYEKENSVKISHQLERERPRNAEPIPAISQETTEMAKNLTDLSSVDVRDSSGFDGSKPIIEQLITRRKILYKTRAALHNSLFYAVSDEMRFDFAKKIMECSKEIDEIHHSLRSFENGVIPKKYMRQTQDAETFMKISNLKLYIKRYNKKIENELHPDKKAYLRKFLEKHENELKHLTDGTHQN
jgi:hypothetical protein